MKPDLHQQLAEFIREQRGDMTYEKFAGLTGVPRSTLHRIETHGHKVRLECYIQLLLRLKRHPKEVMPQVCAGCSGHNHGDPRR